jgi:hypothetical protein
MLYQTQKLKGSLSQFGLNPNDWELCPLESNQVLVQNRVDKEIQMIGQLKHIKSDRLNQKEDESDLVFFQNLQLLPF